MNAPSSNVAAAILVGGRSSRFGSNKLAHVFEGKPFLLWVVEAAQAVSSDVFLVGRAGVGSLDLPVVDDMEGAEGPLAGLAAALSFCKKERLLVLAGDLPLLRAPMLSSLLSLSPEASAVAPEINGRLQPLCAVYAASLAPLARALVQNGERAAHRLFQAAGGVIARPEQLGPTEDVITALQGVNTQEELAALLQNR